jgi:formylglycine-generating enzyme required for sulfatase activity
VSKIVCVSIRVNQSNSSREITELFKRVSVIFGEEQMPKNMNKPQKSSLGHSRNLEAKESRPASSISASSTVGKIISSLVEELGDGVKLEMIQIPGGSFLMGSNEYESEKPIHQVTLSPFAIGRFPLTQAQWKSVMGSNPSNFKGGDLPVERVSWKAAVEFCEALSERTGRVYRLPTEAEWEFSCRAGTDTLFSFGEDSESLDQHAWYYNNSDQKTHAVGQKAPNAWGLHDMHGNVFEWCQDWYDDDYYQQNPVTDPPGPPQGTSHVLRGGSWLSVSYLCRTAYRFSNWPDYRYYDIGFRVVAEIKQ